jgi:hypothetical protein
MPKSRSFAAVLSVAAGFGCASLLGTSAASAVLLTHEGYGHTSEVDPSACVDRDVAKYLTTLATPPSGAVCQSDRLPFDPKLGQPLP